MSGDVSLPDGMRQVRQTPVFDVATMPPALGGTHRAGTWAVLHVVEGAVRFVELEGDGRRIVDVDAGDDLVIIPDVAHRVEPSEDARFWVAFHRPDDAVPPGAGRGSHG